VRSSMNSLTCSRYTEDAFEEASLSDGLGEATCDCQNQTKSNPLEPHSSRVSPSFGHLELIFR
jgi:hypothetical protein